MNKIKIWLDKKPFYSQISILLSFYYTVVSIYVLFSLLFIKNPTSLKIAIFCLFLHIGYLLFIFLKVTIYLYEEIKQHSKLLKQKTIEFDEMYKNFEKIKNENE